MKTLMCLVIAVFMSTSSSTSAYASHFDREGSSFRFSSRSNEELQRRVWELEREVSQLERRLAQLEDRFGAAPDTWLCTLTAMGRPHTGTGPTKAVASHRATNSCRAAMGNESIFCSGTPQCSQ